MKMKYLFFTLSVLLLISCTTKKKEQSKPTKIKGYSIIGSLSERTSKKVYLFNKSGKKIDSALISKNKFVLENSIKTPDCYYLKLDNSEVKHLIILENLNYEMLIDFEKSMIIGGELNTIFNKYKRKKAKFAEQKADLLEQFSKLSIGLRPYLKQVDSIRKIEKKLFTSFVLENDTTVLASTLINQTKLSSKEVSTLKKLLKNSKNERLLRELDILIDDLEIVEAEEKVLRRKSVPLFSGINLKGSTTSLEKLIKGKKAFLIDFWASWCMPCREMSPRIKELYRTYKRKGFDILSVSEDRNVNDWKNAVYTDGIANWHHIYDDFNRISSMFNVTSMPHMVLLDEKGRIIKNKISIEDLEEQLYKIFNPSEE